MEIKTIHGPAEEIDRKITQMRANGWHCIGSAIYLDDINRTVYGIKHAGPYLIRTMIKKG